jgi:hypothetical protein
LIFEWKQHYSVTNALGLSPFKVPGFKVNAFTATWTLGSMDNIGRLKESEPSENHIFAKVTHLRTKTT